jgi:hypothetical protein
VPDVVEDDFKELQAIKEAKFEMKGLQTRKIKFSNLPLELLYNDEIEKIRAIEFKAKKPPEPIKFQIQESHK